MDAQAFALLCGLAVAVLAADIARPPQAWWFLAGTLAGIPLFNPGAAGLPFAPLVTADPAQFALLVFLLAFLRLRGRARPALMLGAGGLVLDVWLQALGAIGYPRAPAALLAVTVAVTSLLASLRRPRFRDARMLEEAFLFVLANALVLAIVPPVLDGWDAAVGLQAVDADGAPAAGGGFGAVAMALLCAVLGCAWAAWRRHPATLK